MVPNAAVATAGITEVSVGLPIEVVGGAGVLAVSGDGSGESSMRSRKAASSFCQALLARACSLPACAA